MFYLIFLIGIAYLFIGGIIGEHYRYTIASIILFFITLNLNIDWAMGFTALFGIVAVAVITFILTLVVVGLADCLKNGILN